MRKYVAGVLGEMVGTFFLALAVSLSLAGQAPWLTPVVAASVLFIGVCAIGPISGAHFNPAVSFAAFTRGAISGSELFLYVFVQYGAARAGAVVAGLLLPPAVLVVNDTWRVFGAELLGTVVLAFGVAAVMHHKWVAPTSGAMVGIPLLVGIWIASSASNGVLNPVIALAIGSFSFFYVLGPMVGGLIGMWLFGLLATAYEHTPREG